MFKTCRCILQLDPGGGWARQKTGGKNELTFDNAKGPRLEKARSLREQICTVEELSSHPQNSDNIRDIAKLGERPSEMELHHFPNGDSKANKSEQR